MPRLTYDGAVFAKKGERQDRSDDDENAEMTGWQGRGRERQRRRRRGERDQEGGRERERGMDRGWHYALLAES